jgi:predicted HD phosphohydrolase
VLQSARLAQKNGVSEKIVLACLLHDISAMGFIRGDHGYWAPSSSSPTSTRK